MAYIYSLMDEGAVLDQLLIEAGNELIIGNGEYDEEHLQKCEILIAGVKPVNAEVLDKAPHLKMVAKAAVGIDNIDIPACRERNIVVTNTPGCNAVSAAEHTMALMLDCAKHIYQMSSYVRREYPDFHIKRRFLGTELNGKTVGIIGLGNIGRKVALLAHAFGMQVIGYDMYVDAALVPEFVDMDPSLDAVLASSDFVTVHIPGTKENWHRFSRHEFEIMKESAVFINTSRGSVVDEEELIHALQQGDIAGAGLDVLEKEPTPHGNPLLFMENVVLTPHVSGNTKEARENAQRQCAKNIFDFLHQEISEEE